MYLARLSDEPAEFVWRQLAIQAWVEHHGTDVRAGHYTCCFLGQQTLWWCDDHAVGRQVTISWPIKSALGV